MKLLCVVPRFAPSNAPDGHRLRLLLPHLLRHGCTPEVLAVDPRDVRCPIDPWLSERLPPEVKVHRVRAWPLSGWGLNGLAQRSLVPLYRTGSRLLRDGSFDVVFFSTTEFLLHLLGPLWQARHGVPFCMDLQDPWVTDYYRQHPSTEPPGGRFKYSAIERVHGRAERVTVPRCSGFLAVSGDYLEDLDRRFGAGVAGRPHLVEPFPAEPAEFQGLSRPPTTARPVVSVWRFVGSAGGYHDRAAGGFFAAWRRAIDTGTIGPGAARFEAIGTSYADSTQPEVLLPVASRFGLESVVSESTARIPYAQALAALASSSAIVLLGTDDPGYTASKLYPCLLAGRPLLVIVHEKSSTAQIVTECGGGVCVTFGADTAKDDLSDRVFCQWFSSGAFTRPVPLDRDRFLRYTAGEQASRVRHWLTEVAATAGCSPSSGGQQAA